MITIHKDPGRDFIILNLTDPQMNNAEWEEGHPHRRTLEYTLAELVERTRPDLITVSGDLAWAGEDHSYRMLMRLLDSFGIPWAPVWGNHDNQKGAEYTEFLADLALSHKNCVYEKGDPVLGNGNYIISVEEAGKPVTAVFMMDSHDRAPFTNAQGETSEVWAKLWPQQLDWYREQVTALQKDGCNDTLLVTHIPIYAYRNASKAAYKNDVNLSSISLQMANGSDVWNNGYTDSVGVQYEDIGSYVHDDGVLEILKHSEIAHHVICGHDHVNNWKICYEGINLIYSLKTGAGCYWDPTLNGGTVLKINDTGIYDVEDVFIDVSHLIQGNTVDS